MEEQVGYWISVSVTAVTRLACISDSEGCRLRDLLPGLRTNRRCSDISAKWMAAFSWHIYSESCIR